MPKGWSDAYPLLASSSRAAVKDRARRLALIFNDSRALDELRQIAGDTRQPAETRQEAIRALTQAKAEGLSKQLLGLLADPAVRIAALRGLAASDDEATPGEVLKKYGEFDAAARQEAISTLASRKGYAMLLLDAVEQGHIRANDLSAFHVQQLQNLKDAAISDRVEKAWGSFRPTSADRAALIARYQQKLTPTVLAGADRVKGRAVFQRTCAACHTLFGEGGKIGPELTGAQRNNLDYLLTNMLDPSAVVAKDYQMTLLVMADGRVISGIVRSEDEQRLSMQTATELVTVLKKEIDSREVTANSMMPDGLLAPLSEVEVRDLMGYLSGSVPVASSEKR